LDETGQHAGWRRRRARGDRIRDEAVAV